MEASEDWELSACTKAYFGEFTFVEAQLGLHIRFLCREDHIFLAQMVKHGCARLHTQLFK